MLTHFNVDTLSRYEPSAPCAVPDNGRKNVRECSAAAIVHRSRGLRARSAATAVLCGRLRATEDDAAAPAAVPAADATAAAASTDRHAAYVIFLRTKQHRIRIVVNIYLRHIDVYAVAPAVGPDPSSLQCPSCRQMITTRLDYETTTKTHIMAALLCCFM